MHAYGAHTRRKSVRIRDLGRGQRAKSSTRDWLHRLYSADRNRPHDDLRPPPPPRNTARFIIANRIAERIYSRRTLPMMMKISRITSLLIFIGVLVNGLSVASAAYVIDDNSLISSKVPAPQVRVIEDKGGVLGIEQLKNNMELFGPLSALGELKTDYHYWLATRGHLEKRRIFEKDGD